MTDSNKPTGNNDITDNEQKPKDNDKKPEPQYKKIKDLEKKEQYDFEQFIEEIKKKIKESEKIKDDSERIILSELIKDIGYRYIYHKIRGESRIIRYRWSSRILAFIIPIFNVVLTGLLYLQEAHQETIKQAWIIGLSLLISLISTISASFSLPENCANLTYNLIKLSEWKVQFMTVLSKLFESENEDIDFYQSLQNMNNELSKIGRDMSKVEVPSNLSNPTDNYSPRKKQDCNTDSSKKQ